MQYVLPLMPIDTGSTRRMTTLHLMLAFVLCGIGAGCFVLYWFTSVSPKFSAAFRPFAFLGAASMAVGLAIAAVAIFYKNWLMEGKRSHWLRAAEVLILAATAITFAVNDQMRPALMFAIIGVAIIAATLWELRKPAAQEAVISPDGIAIPKGGMRQTIRWSEIEGVLLRHGILSIEMTGNRLIQRPVRSDVSIDVSRIEAYSTTLILKYEKERAANAAW